MLFILQLVSQLLSYYIDRIINADIGRKMWSDIDSKKDFLNLGLTQRRPKASVTAHANNH